MEDLAAAIAMEDAHARRYHILDLVPKGRDEANLPVTMSWARHDDRYED